jgi:hypothetical protein
MCCAITITYLCIRQKANRPEKRKISTLHFFLNFRGKVMSLSMKFSTNDFTRTLYQKVEAVTGIPVEHLMLFSGKSFLRPDVKLKEFHLLNGCHLHLTVRGIGGGLSDSESGMCNMNVTVHTVE